MASATEKTFESQQLKLYLKNILKKVFLEDWPMKLAALVITFALWVGVTGLSQPTIQRMNGIPLTLRFSDNVDATSTADEIDIVISGDKRKIDQLNRNDLVVSLDLTNVQPGNQVVQLTPDTVSMMLPTGIKLDEIIPRQIPVKIEIVEVKEVTVNPVTTGQPADGFEVYGQTIDPSKIHVRGPSNLVRSLAMVTTDKIDLSSKNVDFTARQVPISISNPEKVRTLETLVDVTFRIGERRIERSFSVPVKNDAKRKVNVVLFGGRSLFENIKPEDISVEVVKDASGKESYDVDLPPALTDRVEVRKPFPNR
ncbi:MAG TPA: CdaR family protein [Pyrinomonadaceae bacterium]|nr:CdaR family protein [Pyrinomonadaceae bacterium]